MEPARAIWRWASREKPAALAVAWKVWGQGECVSRARRGQGREGVWSRACGATHLCREGLRRC